MDLHYNAFISYRHHPDDIRVAEDIHRSLERFRVPKAIRKKTKGITRLFRDKDELPITSSLTDDIYRALENSDYLIVICSVHTKESIWVQREIETFLKTHDRNKVLTVLASGEPYDVIPEILLYEDRYDEETGQTVRIEYEPLSCDWRMGRKQAIREELPRLAAALLGCGYDELRQRQRQYRMRRMITFFSLALAASVGLSAYFLHTSIRIQKANDDLKEANDQISAANTQIQQANVQIQDNLDQALRNQSEYLASSSQERMEAGDRLTAICLALAALPDDQNQRPYVPGAELALSKALASYEAEDTIHAVGAFTADSMINDFRVTEDGNLIYILDVRGVLSVWDTMNFERLGTANTGVLHNSKMCVTPENNILLLSSDNRLLCYGNDGQLRWQMDTVRDIAFLDQRTQLMVLRNPALAAEEICFADPNTGEYVQSVFLLEDKEDSYLHGFSQLEFDSAYPVLLTGSNVDHNLLFPVDTQKRIQHKPIRFASGSLLEGYINCASVTENGNILVMVSDGSGAMNGNYGTFQLTSPSRSVIFCYHGVSHTLMWRSEIITSIYSGGYTMESIPGQGKILCQSGTRFQVYEESTGEQLAACDTPAIPLTVMVEEDQIMGVSQTGSMYYYDPVDNSCQSLPFFDGNLTAADVNRGCYVLKALGQDVTLYRSIKDDSGVALKGQYDLIIKNQLVCGNHMAVLTNDYLYMFDLESMGLLWKSEGRYGNKLLGFTRDGTQVLMWNNFDDVVEIFQVSDGTCETVEISGKFDAYYGYLDSDIYMHDDQLWYAAETQSQWQLRGYDLHTREEQVYPVEALAAEDPDYASDTILLHKNGQSFLLWRSDGSLLKLDLQKLTLNTLETGHTDGVSCVYEQEEEKLLLLSGNEVLIVEKTGSIDARVNLEERKAVGACLWQDTLFTLCDDGEVYRYDLQGNLLSITTLNIYDTFYSKIGSGSDPADITWNFTSDGDLILNAYTAGNIIDCGQWKCRGYVPRFVAYDAQNDRIVCLCDDGLIAFNRYTTQMLMDKAMQTLNGFTLTQEQKQAYGIS